MRSTDVFPRLRAYHPPGEPHRAYCDSRFIPRPVTGYVRLAISNPESLPHASCRVGDSLGQTSRTLSPLRIGPWPVSMAKFLFSTNIGDNQTSPQCPFMFLTIHGYRVRSGRVGSTA
jgi:hypothetical protein